MSPADIPPSAQDLGLVSGYCVMGTGFFSEFVSLFTDFFGRKSGAYGKKVKKAEKEALTVLAENAQKLGANAVFNVRVNIQEATHGHGMLVFYASGAAARVQAAQHECAVKTPQGAKLLNARKM